MFGDLFEVQFAYIKSRFVVIIIESIFKIIFREQENTWQILLKVMIKAGNWRNKLILMAFRRN